MGAVAGWVVALALPVCLEGTVAVVAVALVAVVELVVPLACLVFLACRRALVAFADAGPAVAGATPPEAAAAVC